MRIPSLLLFLLGFCNYLSAQSQIQTPTPMTVTDARDGISYEIFQLDNQNWFQTNLKFISSTSWCAENPDSKACETGNFYFANDLNEVCPSGWRVPSWSEYRSALKEIEKKEYGIEDSIEYIEGKVPSKKYDLAAERVFGITLLQDSLFFNMVATGWIEGHKWVPQPKQTNMWIREIVSGNPQPHLHIRENEVTMHAHEHHVMDKPRKTRRFSVRCISDID